MKPRICLIFFISLFLFSKEISAQQKPFAFKLITGSKDVSLGKIAGITQDKWGYMWFVDQTYNQLIRYDGYRMKIFKTNPADTNTINSTSGIENIAADTSGNIWLPAGGGVDKLNSSTGIVTHYKLKSGSDAIIVDHLGFVWLGNAAGLCRLDPKTGKADYYGHDEHDSTSISSNVIRVIYEDHEGTIWTGNGIPFDPDKDGGLNKFNRSTGKFTRYMHNPNDPHSLINDKVRAILEDSRGNFWVGTQGDGLHIMDRKTGTFERLTYDPAHPEKLSRPPVKKVDSFDHITFIKEDISGNIWIGTYEQGIVRYNPATKKINHFIADKITPNGFNDSTTWCAYTSRDGTLWIATEVSKLLYSVDAFRKSIYTIHTGNTASSFLQDENGNLWAGTEGNGIFKFDQHYNLLQHFKHDPSDSSSIANDRTTVQFLPNEGKVLSLTQGIRVMDKYTNKFSRFSNDSVFRDSKTTGFVDLILDKQGIYWFTNWGRGLIRYDPKNNLSKQFTNDPKDSSSISSDLLNHIIEDSKGRLWVAGGGGLNKLNRKTGRFKRYIAETFIGSVYEDSRNNVWAGTAKGLYHYDEKKDTFSLYFDPSSSLYSTAVGGIIEDDDHNLWFNSGSVIIKLNPLTKQFFIYGDKFGIGSNSMDPWCKPYKNKKGQLLYGYGDGFCIFYPQELNLKTNFKIILTGFFINTIPIASGSNSNIQQPVEELTDLNLKYNQNNIAFNFSTFDYRDPESIQYFTMLDGYDNTWRDAKDEKSSRYFNLPRGKYTYRIKAFSKEGAQAEKTITITINPPWWQTWWAYTLYALVLIIATWGFIKWRTKIFEKEKIILEQKVSERTKELKEEKEIVESTLSELKNTQAQLIQTEKMASLGELTAGIAHEIQNPLNFVNNFSEVSSELIDEMNEEINKGNLEDAKEIANDLKQNLEKINHHGKRADAIVKGMLQHSRSSTGVKEPTDINALCDEYLRLAYHGLRAKDNSFNATMKTDFDESIGKIDIIPQDIGRVILNLINNAFYVVDEKRKSPHALKGGEEYEPVVTVTTKRLGPPLGDGGKVSISVKDNGNGIPQKILDKIFQPFFTTKPTGQGTGLGLSLSYDIVKAHGGELKMETKQGEGSEFIIQLPVV